MSKEKTAGRSAGVWRAIAVLMLGLAVAGCSTTQLHTSGEHRVISLKSGDLRGHGVAFITPSTVTGQEEEKQAVALSFAAVLMREMPDVRVVTLPETLSAVNQNGLADDYRSMFTDYRDTGIFRKAALKRVGEATGARYLAKLKLAGFSQGSNNRFGVLGFRIVDTQYAKLRLFFQIWDSVDGTIAWEGMQELVYAKESFSEKAVTLKTVIEKAAHELIARLPDRLPPEEPHSQHASPAGSRTALAAPRP